MSGDIQTDQALIEAFVNGGDQSCFSEIVQRHAPMVYRVCSRVLGNHHDAEDATQAVFAVLIKKAKSIRKQQSLASWLHGVARTTSLHHLRTEARRRKREEEVDMSESNIEPTITDEDRAHILKLVDEALARLSGQQREAVVLRFLEGHSVETAASLLGCPSEVLKSRTRHAMARLRASLAKRGITIGTAMLTTILVSEANAAVPTDVLSSVAASASAIAAGTAVGTVSGSAISLTQGVMKMYTVMKIKMIGLYAAAVLSVGLGIGTFAGVVYHKDVQVIGTGPFQGPMMIGSLCISPDSQFLAAGYRPGYGKKGTVSIWHIASMREVKRIPFDGSVCDMTYDSSGKRLYLLMSNCGEHREGRLIVWDIEKNKLLFEKNLPNNPAMLSLNEKKQAVCVVTGPDVDMHERPDTPPEIPPFYRHLSENIVAWDMNTGAKLKSWDGVARREENRKFAVEWFSCSSDGTKLIAVDNNTGASGGAGFSKDNLVTILDWDTGKVLHTWTTHDKHWWCTKVIWLPGDERIMFIGRGATTSSKESPSLVFDVASGKVLHQFPGCCFLNPDKTQIIGITNDTLVAYSATTFERVNGESLPAQGMKSNISPVMSPDGHWLVAIPFYSHTPFVLDMLKKQRLSPCPDAFQATPIIQYAADGRLFAYDEWEAVHVFDEAGKVLSVSRKMVMRYCSWDPEGRFLLCSEGENGAELWDTVLGQPVKKRADHRGYLDHISLAPTLTHAATLGQYDGTLKIHDLETGRIVSEVQGPTHNFFKRTLHLKGMFWDIPRRHVALGDSNVGWFHEEEDLKKPGSFGTIDVAGIIDMNTGARLYRFVNEEGTPAVEVDLQACGHDMLYGSAYFEKTEKNTIVLIGDKTKKPAPTRNCLWRLSDGGFLRYMPDITACSSENSVRITMTCGDKSKTIDSPDINDVTPSWHGGEDVRFSEDGKLIYGPLGVVDVETGALIRKHKKQWLYSPSYTLAIDIDRQSRLNIYDADSNILLWQQPLLKDPGEVSIRRLIWHPAESRMALTVEGQATLLQVELFQPVDYPKDLTMQQAIDMLGHEDIQKRMIAASFLRAQGKDAIAGLQQCCGKSSDPATRQSAMAVLVLEQLARGGLTTARTALEKMESAQAQSAVKRLDTFGHVQALRKKNEIAEAVGAVSKTR